MRYNMRNEKQPTAARQTPPRQGGTVMDFWKNAAESVTKAVDFVVDKNRRAAMMNRLKIVIRGEKEAEDHAFAQLGKYYYQNMRNPENGDTEPYCLAIDTAGDAPEARLCKVGRTCGADGGSPQRGARGIRRRRCG